VTDNVTGLMWQRVVPPASYNWADAKNYCGSLNLGGLTGWRLPMRIELLSIVDVTVFSPTINGTAFPDTPTVTFWSASPVAYATNHAWNVSFASGYTRDNPVSSSNRVRCVR
jgi:hypothetical protein